MTRKNKFNIYTELGLVRKGPAKYGVDSKPKPPKKKKPKPTKPKVKKLPRNDDQKQATDLKAKRDKKVWM